MPLSTLWQGHFYLLYTVMVIANFDSGPGVVNYYTLDILIVVFSYTQAIQYPPVLNA